MGEGSCTVIYGDMISFFLFWKLMLWTMTTILVVVKIKVSSKSILIYHVVQCSLFVCQKITGKNVGSGGINHHKRKDIQVELWNEEYKLFALARSGMVPWCVWRAGQNNLV